MMHKLSFVLAAFAVAQSSGILLIRGPPTVSAMPAVEPITTTEGHAVTTVVTDLRPTITVRPHTTVLTETELATTVRHTTVTVDGKPVTTVEPATTTLTHYLTEVTREPATTTLTELRTTTFFTTGPVTTLATVSA
ncbi:hypothetical protein BC628DRAFT_1337009 [Trametes gibbosa]|nr:hypothetical protein BC628DRAFT_1337009 [Trametes gibbosa]